MPITCKITPGYNYGPADTVTSTNLNSLGEPAVEVPDGETLQFARAFLADGTSSAPSLTLISEQYTGLYREGAGVVTWANNKQDVFSFTADGIVMETGKAFKGPVLAPVGTVSAPSIAFEYQTNTGIYWNGGLHVAAQGVDVASFTNSLASFAVDTLIDNDLTVTGSVSIDGALTVTGKITGAFGNMQSGSAALPGLPQQADTTTGFYRPALVNNIAGIGIAVGSTPILRCVEKTANQPQAVISHGSDDTDYSAQPAMLTVNTKSGWAALRFDDSTTSPGVGTMAVDNAPTSGQPLWIRAYLGIQKVVIPALPHNWT